ncbi:transporter substrate-binding domain-containing protein [Uliginosibacterium paludis]|uniref:Transporter substrate-binding domain-containing protein n=1 Tax=Uliginosibacterium paludis TaxID=1615952 RepID=A0ABV2CTG9_9RHOO
MNMLLRTLLASVAGLVVSQACLAEDLLAKVKAGKQITVATEARYAPFEYVEGGKIVGYDVDLLQYVMAGALPGVKNKTLDLPFQGLLPGLDAKRFDMIIAAVTANRERVSKFAFTLPIAEATIGVLTRADSAGSIKAPADLNGKVAGAQIGSVQTDALKALDKKLKEAGGAGLKEIKEYVAYDEAYADLATGRLDAVAQSLSNLGPLMKSRPGVFAVLPQTIGPKSYFAWVARKDADSAALVKAMNEGIARANKDGTMKKLQMKWFGMSMDLPVDALPEPSM